MTDDELDELEEFKDEILLEAGRFPCKYPDCPNTLDPKDWHQVESGYCWTCIGDAQ